MNRRFALRYRTSTLFVVLTSVAILLGYAHWRRTSMIRQSETLELLGVRVLWPDQPDDTFWPVVPEEAEFAFSEISPNVIRVADTSYTLEQARTQQDEIITRLKRLGVQFVVPVKNGQRLTFMVPTGAEQR